MILCNFADGDDRSRFIAATGIVDQGSGSVLIPLSLVSMATSMGGTVEQQDNQVRRFLVKVADPQTITTPVTVVTSQGANGKLTANNNDFWVVDSSEGLNLYYEFPGCVEQIDVPVKLLSEITTGITEGLPTDQPNYNWPRLRTISRTRPFASQFLLAQTTFSKKPNLVIIDSGINFTHDEFENVDTEDLFTLPVFNNDFRDDAGHGTAVASFACGKNVGLHRHLKLLNCKIFSVTFKPNAIEIGQALDACYNRFIADTSVPMIVNCSWTVAKNSYLEGKFQDLISAGISVVCAAGNTNIDVSMLTPAGMTDVITVAASDIDDIGAGFNNFSEADFAVSTNFGLQVDLFAPGVDCIGAHYSGNSKYCKFSGTSISAGFVSGCLAAIYAVVSTAYKSQAEAILIQNASKGVLLLDIEKYDFDQNNLAYLITSENSYSVDSPAFYLGAFNTATTTIVGNAGMLMNFQRYAADTGESFNFNVLWETPQMETEADASLSIDNAGTFTITNPPVPWNSGEKIKLMQFKIEAVSTSNSITFMSPDLIFFASNPEFQDSLTGDISTSLENIDSQSFFAAWTPSLSIK